MSRTAEGVAIETASCEAAARKPRGGLAGRLQWGAVWVIGGRVAGIGVTLLANVVLARQLVPDDYGKFNLLASLIALLSSVAMVGLSGAVVRFIPESLALGQDKKAKDTLRMAYGIVVVVWLVAALAIVLNWKLLASWLAMPTDRTFALILVASGGLLALLQLTAESLRSYHELRFASLLSGGQTGGLLSNAVFLMILVGWGLYQPATLSSSLWINVVAMLAITPLALRFLVRTVQGEGAKSKEIASPETMESGPRLSALLAVSFPLMLVQCVTLASGQADLWIAGVSCSADDLALYSAARRLMLLVTMPLQMVNFLVISSIAELKTQKRTRELESLLQTTSTLAAIPAILALSLLAICGTPILQTVFGDFYRAAALPLAILSVGQFVLTWAGSSHSTLLMTGHQNIVLTVNTAGALLLMVGGTFAAEQFGMMGLAVTSTAVVTLENIVLMVLIRRLEKISPYVPLSWRTWRERLMNLDLASRLANRGKVSSPAQENHHAD